VLLLTLTMAVIAIWQMAAMTRAYDYIPANTLPSLQVLDRMNQRTIVIGWAFLTIGMIVGVVWAAQAQAYASPDPRVQAMTVHDPKIFVALVCWIVYSFELFAARQIGWGGRRAAYLSALGFAIVLLNLVPISYFLTKSHNF
jgi:ABC-type transport system involved in cytochrome c biogenesis permease subunit